MYRRLWKQEVLDLDGANERAAAESDGEEGQCEEVAIQEETLGRDWSRGILR